MLEDPFFRRFFDIPDMGPRERVFQSAGSGVIFDAKNGYIVTNAHVVDNATEITVTLQDGRAALMKLPELDSFDDREAKPANIALHIGRRPLLAFGNSDGDLAMLRYANSGAGARLPLLLHHDDAEREAAYDREFRLSPLAEALDKAEQYGVTVVSMKRDWKAVFPD